ncbi:ABC transporter permease [Citrobacter braakii]|uniref:ABC transporter permease n=1 Tax=Citrobacter braakii TaxID=57706 RepID=UPI0028BDEA2E|nr:ABC transporter permease [Citrobacter braakii]MDT7128617.1 ABC transporter permease [Citrobacter braakii]MDX7348022.1 ABC transporter permease [Citrobacter braakii]
MSVKINAASLSSLTNSLWLNRSLIFQMTKRDILSKYKGSAIGVVWSLINPILMLMIYTLVFSVVFKARWGAAAVNEPKTQFAIILFVGLIMHSFLAECLLRAPNLILQYSNYVKKVVFPLEILPIVVVLSAVFQSLISSAVLIMAFFIFNGFVNWTIIFAPLVFLPLIILSLGLTWLISSLGVYIRDIGQSIGVIVTVLIFLSPVFYPLSALPSGMQHIVLLNPLTYIIEQSRSVIVWGQLPDFVGLSIYSFVSLCLTYFCYIWFQKTRKGFADVI